MQTLPNLISYMPLVQLVYRHFPEMSVKMLQEAQTSPDIILITDSECEEAFRRYISGVKNQVTVRIYEYAHLVTQSPLNCVSEIRFLCMHVRVRDVP